MRTSGCDASAETVAPVPPRPKVLTAPAGSQPFLGRAPASVVMAQMSDMGQLSAGTVMVQMQDEGQQALKDTLPRHTKQHWRKMHCTAGDPHDALASRVFDAHTRV